jgi:hypothetical protein
MRTILVACLLVVSVAVAAVADRPVLVLVSPGYHSTLLQGVVLSLLDKGHDVIVAAGGSIAQVREDLVSVKDEISIIAHTQAPESSYFAVLTLGASWYEDVFLGAAMNLSYGAHVDTATSILDDAVDKGATIGSLGAGVYVLPWFSGLAAGTKLAAYDCPDLYGFIEDYDLIPIIASGSNDPLSGRYGPEAETVVSTSGESWVVTLSVPDTWYSYDFGDELWRGYGDAVERMLGEFTLLVPTSMEPYVISPWTEPDSFAIPDWTSILVYNPHPTPVEVTAARCDEGGLDDGCPCSDPTRRSQASTTVRAMGLSTYDLGEGAFRGSVTIESAEPVVAIVNRNPVPIGASCESFVGLPEGEPAVRWTVPHLETGGAARAFFHVVNLSDVSAQVEVNYVGSAGVTHTATGEIGPNCTTRFDPATTVGGPWQGAAIVTSDVEIAVTKTIVSSREGSQEAHTCAAVAEESSRWYLPTLCSESNVAGTSRCWVDFYNPNPMASEVTVTVTLDDGAPWSAETTLAPGASARLPGEGIGLGDWCGSAMVSASQPIVVGATAHWVPIDETPILEYGIEAITEGATLWVLPVARSSADEKGNIETDVVIQNLAPFSMEVDLTFYDGDGNETEMNLPMTPGARRTLDVEETPTGSWGAVVVAASDGPILVERVTSWRDAFGHRGRPHGTFGGSKPSDRWDLDYNAFDR